MRARGLEHLSTVHWIGSIPRGTRTGPLDRLALPRWCVHWGGSYNKHGTGSRCTLRAQLENRAFLVRDQSAKDHLRVRDRERQVRDRSPPLTPADGHHRCFWLRHRPNSKACAMRSPTSSELASPRSGLLCGRLLVALVESVLCPGGWENVCR